MPLPLRNRFNLRFVGDDYFSHAQRIHFPQFSLYFSPNDLSYPRFSFVVPKKSSRLAVKRNLLRRQLTGIIQPLLSQLQISQDITFVLKPASLSLSFDDLETAVKNGLEAIKSK